MEVTEPEGKIREANMRLPEHQREALAFRELDGLSYDEIATIMGTNRSAVAQLISRARINLHDELRGNVLASVAAPSPECERALPLIAMRDDGQLDAASGDATWLDAHLSGCGRCRLGVEVMREAASSYRALSPVASRKRAVSAGADRRSGSRRRVPLVAGLAALLLLAAVATAVIAGDEPPATPVDAASGPAAGPSAAARRSDAGPASADKLKGRTAKKKKARTRETASETPAETPTGGTTQSPTSVPVPTATEGGAPRESASRPNRAPGKTEVEPGKASAPDPSPKPKPAPMPTSTAAPQPAPAPPPAPPAEEPPPAEESPGKSKGHVPPGKPADRPPK
jgi:predicted DNA-binding protein (UPF0251 family)